MEQNCLHIHVHMLKPMCSSIGSSLTYRCPPQPCRALPQPFFCPVLSWPPAPAPAQPLPLPCPVLSCPPACLPLPPAAFPRAPTPAVAAVLSPLAWLYGRPDLFDSYSCGVLLMQMAVPQLRSQAQVGAGGGGVGGVGGCLGGRHGNTWQVMC
jgi:hypothetical protein